jgi:hypothetical protein
MVTILNKNKFDFEIALEREIIKLMNLQNSIMTGFITLI